MKRLRAYFCISGCLFGVLALLRGHDEEGSEMNNDEKSKVGVEGVWAHIRRW